MGSSGSLQKWFLLEKVRVQQPIFWGWYLCQSLRFLERFENPFSTNNLHLESALGLMKPVNVQSDFTLIPYPSQNEGSPGGRKAHPKLDSHRSSNKLQDNYRSKCWRSYLKFNFVQPPKQTFASKVKLSNIRLVAALWEIRKATYCHWDTWTSQVPSRKILRFWSPTQVCVCVCAKHLHEVNTCTVFHVSIHLFVHSMIIVCVDV